MLIATKIAMEYRQKYAKDVFIEQHCFRRWGHNELDDPTMTNPLLYKQITNRQSVPDAYVETLKDNVDIDNEVVKNHSAILNDHFKQIETYQVTFLYVIQCIICSDSGVDSRGAGGARVPPEFVGSEKGQYSDFC